MYWNMFWPRHPPQQIWLIETWDVLKLVFLGAFVFPDAINRNMRCIEIWFIERPSRPYVQINRNMRCIEIIFRERRSTDWGKINRNMRCIEIRPQKAVFLVSVWLIETWDVLKLINQKKFNVNSWLIETWDVLKFSGRTICDNSAFD